MWLPDFRLPLLAAVFILEAEDSTVGHVLPTIRLHEALDALPELLGVCSVVDVRDEEPHAEKRSGRGSESRVAQYVARCPSASPS